VHCLLVSLVVVIGGCNDREATALAPIVAIEPALVGLVDSCSSLVGGTQSATIGKDGGVIAVGPDTLIIPSGALARSTMITATIPTGSSVNVVAFQPDGLKFKKAVTLALSYAACGSLTGSVTIAQVDDSMHIITYLKTKTNRVTRQVTGQLQHFSNYALAY
jgi:uncharacterized membrane protein YfcA